jgi:gliding motility-associated-like protein
MGPSCKGFLDGVIEVGEVFSGSEPIRYSIDGSVYTLNNYFPGLAAGSYQIALRDAYGCTMDTLIHMPEGAQLDIVLSADVNLINLGESAILTGVIVNENPIDFIEWSPPFLIENQDKLENIVSPTESTLFTLSVTDEKGCSSTAEQLISVIERPDLYIPNIFSPNGDDINDTFFIAGETGVEKILVFEVFDRWGNRVYHTENIGIMDPENGWNGYFNGSRALPGVYVYHIAFISSNGKHFHLSGDVALIW